MSDRLSAAAEKVKDLVRKFYALPRYLPAPTQMQIDALISIVSHMVQDAEKAAAGVEREKVATRLRHVADGYEEGGHTHRARAFRAIADEFGR